MLTVPSLEKGRWKKKSVRAEIFARLMSFRHDSAVSRLEFITRAARACVHVSAGSGLQVEGHRGSRCCENVHSLKNDADHVIV